MLDLNSYEFKKMYMHGARNMFQRHVDRRPRLHGRNRHRDVKHAEPTCYLYKLSTRVLATRARMQRAKPRGGAVVGWLIAADHRHRRHHGRP